MEFTSNLPSGAGLSSSAALEVSTALAVLALIQQSMSQLEIAKLCRRAENEFVGVNCGLLDQATSVGGRLDQLVEIDCRTEEISTVPCPSGVAFIVVSSGVKHALVGGEYNERREHCFEAAKLLGLTSLRDASTSLVAASGDVLPDVVRRRALHITGENERVLCAASSIRSGNLAELGRLMFESHESSRVNFENSTPELDTLVGLASRIEGVLGARLTGGGFGGSVVVLAEQKDAIRVSTQIALDYRSSSGIVTEPKIYRPAQGAHLLSAS
jgi:galactokinase